MKILTLEEVKKSPLWADFRGQVATHTKRAMYEPTEKELDEYFVNFKFTEFEGEWGDSGVLVKVWARILLHTPISGQCTHIVIKSNIGDKVQEAEYKGLTAHSQVKHILKNIKVDFPKSHPFYNW